MKEHRALSNGAWNILPAAAALLGVAAGCCPSCEEAFPDVCRVDVVSDPAARAVAREIDAAGKAAAESSRLEALRRIAGRAGLPPAAQVYLVNAVFAQLSSDAARRDVLLGPARRASFHYAARRCLAARLKQVASGSIREQLRRALEEGGGPATRPGGAR